MPKRNSSYDDIVRRTVIEPDGSFRPSAEQERQAYEGFRAMDAEEQALWTRVRSALAHGGVDLEHVSVEVERDRVFVRGTVQDSTTQNRIPELIHSVEGVGDVVDLVVIDASGTTTSTT
ncbi:MAG: BON domain-containing protein [Kofleriaceae bacterium]